MVKLMKLKLFFSLTLLWSFFTWSVTQLTQIRSIHMNEYIQTSIYKLRKLYKDVKKRFEEIYVKMRVTYLWQKYKSFWVCKFTPRERERERERLETAATDLSRRTDMIWERKIERLRVTEERQRRGGEQWPVRWGWELLMRGGENQK